MTDSLASRAVSIQPTRPTLTAAALLMSVLLTCVAAAQQTPRPPAAQPSPTPPAQPVLTKIDFVGLKRVRAEDATAASGLQLGQAIDVDAVDRAADLLMSSGLFSKLAYNYRADGKGQTVVTFKVEETSGARAPVVFDNFVWFTDAELNEYVARLVPGYDGTAVDTGNTTESITKALNGLLQARSIRGEVQYTPSADPVGRHPEHIFSVKGANLRVCSLKFPGASGVREEVLLQKSGGIFSEEYSRQFVRAFVQENLIPLLHERGLLRASFRLPMARPAPGEECLGVAVTVPVDEGSSYVWDHAEWSGNAGLTAEELTAALGMRTRELANGQKIAAGIGAAERAYSRKGYLTAKLTPALAFDDAARSVTYRFNVNEGPQFTMGELFITGLSEKDTNNIRTRWNLASREPYDAGYLADFLKKPLAEFIRDPSTDARATGQTFKIETSERRDPDKFTVDVTINFVPQPKK